MIREHFQKELIELEKELISMGGMVTEALSRSIEALKSLDMEAADRIVEEDERINDYRDEIEERTIQLIATQQPVASDLRELITFLDMIINLERMGDHAKGIAQIVRMHGNQPLAKPLIDIPKMAAKVAEMIEGSLRSFIGRDLGLAQKTIDDDSEIDRYHELILRELMESMSGNPELITPSTYLIWVAHNLERIADRATNICERVQFMIAP